MAGWAESWETWAERLGRKVGLGIRSRDGPGVSDHRPAGRAIERQEVPSARMRVPGGRVSVSSSPSLQKG